MRRLVEHYRNPILLVEGNVDEIEDQLIISIFYGVLSTVALEFKIPIIPTPSATHTAKLLVSLSMRKDNQKHHSLKKLKKSTILKTTTLSFM